jgi:D-alanyl-D-alanine carboxypeptidase/D-alanyl-D-alanine-endopeptidase (penicillin-binding protein 4)
MINNSLKALLILAVCLTTSALAQTPSPTPVTTPSPSRLAAPIQTLASLQEKIRQRLLRPEVRRGRVGIKIGSLNSGAVVFENDSEKYFMPASNMKNFTVSTAMERLSPDFRIVTSVYAPAPPDSSGTVKGELRIYGRGDVSISTAFNNSDYYKGLDNLVDKIVQAGVKRVEGDLVGDESYFSGDALPGTWEWDDLQTYYGAEISALPINDNAVDISITPGQSGYPCFVKILPLNPIMKVTNKCTTTPTGGKRDLRMVKLLNQNVIEVSGSVPANDSEYKDSIAITHPAELFMFLLRQRLDARGIVVTGATRVENPQPVMNGNGIPAPTRIEIAKLESPPFSEIAAKTMKPSQNMYTETILRMLGEQVGRPQGGSGESMQLGLATVKGFLASIGVPADGIVQYDGSGLSRHDLITPSAVVTLYTYMAKQSKYAQAWRDSLTIAGVDGTLRNRMKGTAVEGNLRGKTGTIDQVSALSGYLTTAGGEQLVLSILVNGVPIPRERTSLIDDIVVNLATFNGKIDQ